MNVLQIFLKLQRKDPAGSTCSTCLWVVSFKATLPRKTACHSSDSLLFMEKSSAKSIPPFSKLFVELVGKLKWQLDNSASQKLLIDLVGTTLSVNTGCIC